MNLAIEIFNIHFNPSVIRNTNYIFIKLLFRDYFVRPLIYVYPFKNYFIQWPISEEQVAHTHT